MGRLHTATNGNRCRDPQPDIRQLRIYRGRESEEMVEIKGSKTPKNPSESTNLGSQVLTD